MVSDITHTNLKKLERGDKQVIFEALADWIAELATEQNPDLAKLASFLRINKTLNYKIGIQQLLLVERQWKEH